MGLLSEEIGGFGSTCISRMGIAHCHRHIFMLNEMSNDMMLLLIGRCCMALLLLIRVCRKTRADNSRDDFRLIAIKITHFFLAH